MACMGFSGSGEFFVCVGDAFRVMFSILSFACNRQLLCLVLILCLLVVCRESVFVSVFARVIN